MAKKATVQKSGRPPAGPGGARVRDYPQLNMRVPPALRAQLAAITRTTGWSQVEVITRALECLRREMSKRKA